MTSEERKIDLIGIFLFMLSLILILGQVITILQIRKFLQPQKQEQEKQKETHDVDDVMSRKHLYNLGVVTVFYYSNTISQTDSSPNTTAWGEKVYEGMIAVSPDLLKTVVKKNDCVILEINGEVRTYVVNDVMSNKHFRSVDIFTFSRNKKILNSRIAGRLYLINKLK